MTPLPGIERRRGKLLKIVSVNPSEQRKRVRDAIAGKAYEICESRHFEPDHELEDWQQAEAAIVHSLNCGCLMLDDKIALTTGGKPFEKREIEICVEPRRLTICSEEATGTDTSRSNNHLTFYSIEQPLEIDRSRVTARWKSRTIE